MLIASGGKLGRGGIRAVSVILIEGTLGLLSLPQATDTLPLSLDR